MISAGHIAAVRFGLGPRPDQPPVAGGPEEARAALLAQLAAPPDQAMPPRDWEQEPSVADGLAIQQLDTRNPLPPGTPNRRVAFYTAEAEAYFARLIGTPTPFRERLVAFWANHFTVSRREGAVFVLAGDYLRSAIRPHVTGPFAGLLKAAIRHPAMLLYLNQNSSVGPDSAFGRRSRRGLNENLGREILELHTLSPEAGYSQEDVTEFSRLLTGLGVEQARDPRGTVFRAANHQPGEKTVLGKTFPPGEDSIDAALEWLASHPATHRHLARKLARHFVADDPPPEAVERLHGVLRDTGGDLGAVSRELVSIPEAWDPPLGKLRAPFDLVLAAFRAMGAGPERAEMAVNSLNPLGQPLWSPIGPNGWPDRAADWIHAEGMMLRIDRMHMISGVFSRRDAREALDLTLGPLASEPTRLAVMRAASNREALTLLLGSPEFQRR
ncbi:Uncharacterized conserved protein, DUF1800 family [Roseomonas rosea]|uniref:Uncharacterized conserved protein, DUF1800 family n=1 Tax=Muricoccus roseus TaxID=198092 RepID=A0A1M6KXT6_9PROT|nr:DUF1800 domain-containing protein [Roseomonas rosea]SHJ63750.1 Uncharacterized conserved protein, DUF1800 family [Roseomonas rosea]